MFSAQLFREENYENLSMFPSLKKLNLDSVLAAILCLMPLPMTGAGIGPAQFAEGSDWIEQSDVTHDGVSALRSGQITDNHESVLETSVTGPGKLTVWWKVSSEGGSGLLRFRID